MTAEPHAPPPPRPPATDAPFLDSTLLLWRQLLREPARIGTVAPSSPWLAQMLVRMGHLDDGQVIVEVGAGTGPLTGWIHAAAPGARHLALEPDPALREELQRRHAGVDVSERPAAELREALAERGLRPADRVLSSVPWSLFPGAEMERQIGGLVDAMAPGGRFVTLVYAHANALPSTRRLEGVLRQRFERVSASPVVWRNLPPGRWVVAEAPRA